MYLSADSKFHFQCKKRERCNFQQTRLCIHYLVSHSDSYTYIFIYIIKPSGICVYMDFFLFSFLILRPFVVPDAVLVGGDTIFLGFKIHHLNRNISFFFQRPLFFALKLIVSYCIMSSTCEKRR